MASTGTLIPVTTARNDRRPGRRPEWLRRKHGHAWPKPRTKLDLWADKVVQILNDYQTGQRTTPWPDQASADAARKALSRAARRAGVSVGAYLADPDTGTCANCGRMQCQPTRRPVAAAQTLQSSVAGSARTTAEPRKTHRPGSGFQASGPLRMPGCPGLSRLVRP